MSKTRGRARSKSAGASFVPLVLVGPAGERRDALEKRLASTLDVDVRSIEPSGSAARRSPLRACGVAVLVPGGEDPRTLIEPVFAADPSLPIVVALDEDSAVAAMDALKAGALDVILPGEPGEPVVDRIREWIRSRAIGTEGSLFGDGPGMPRMLGSSPQMRGVARLVERVATAEATTVLILGESGTGKELIARAIHALSTRRDGPFMAINCAAIPDTLLENELFGHERGAFTGANATAIGKVEAANGGTLFLDEIGEMPIGLQAKILRLLQEKTFLRIGGTGPRKADIRIVTATNRDLKTEAAAGRFREDLYYRLSVVPVALPPLRDRPEDVPVIARAIVRRLADSLGRPGLSLEEGAMTRLCAYRWPGNVRELENELERAAVMARTDTISPGDLELKSRVDDPERAALSEWIPLAGTLDEAVAAAKARAERLRVSIALEESGGDREAAAQALGITTERLGVLLEDLATGDG